MKAYSRTDIGQHRQVNQDYTFLSLEPVGNLPNLFIVADGMGGHQAGEFASEFTVERAVAWIRSAQEANPIHLLNMAIEYSNAELIGKAIQDPGLYGMGTTIVMACVIDSVLYVANVGDSRLYVMGSHLNQVTRDHSLVEEMVAKGELTRDSQGYAARKNIITRAIGASHVVTADCFELDLNGAQYILLCSDGLTNMLTDQEIEETIRHTYGLEDKVESLISAANARGGKDNIAVLLVEYGVSEVGIC